MSGNNEKQWPQDYYKHGSIESKMSFTNSAQSFYNKGNSHLNDCSQCYYQTDEKKNNEHDYPQSFYHSQDSK